MKSELLKHKTKANYSTAKENLKRLQALPLEQKLLLTERRIKEYYDYFNGQVYVSFSGGKDSTVLYMIVKSMYPEVPAVFVNTGLEYPEIVDFVYWLRGNGNPIVELRPEMPFNKVIEKYGYPVIGKEQSQKIAEIRNTKSEKLRNKRLYGDAKKNGKLAEKWKYLIDAPFKISDRCCHVLKKIPIKKYEKQSKRNAITAEMAAESRLRETQYLKSGCNSFTGRPMSKPMSFWTDRDVWDFIHKYKTPYSKIYDMGETRTGCMFCLFGCQFNDEDGIKRFERMKTSHPKQYNYCMNKLGLKKVIDFVTKGE